MDIDIVERLLQLLPSLNVQPSSTETDAEPRYSAAPSGDQLTTWWQLVLTIIDSMLAVGLSFIPAEPHRAPFSRGVFIFFKSLVLCFPYNIIH